MVLKNLTKKSNASRFSAMDFSFHILLDEINLELIVFINGIVGKFLKNTHKLCYQFGLVGPK